MRTFKFKLNLTSKNVAKFNFCHKVSDEDKLKNTHDILEKIKKNELSKLKPKEFNIIKFNEYKTVVMKSLYNYRKIPGPEPGPRGDLSEPAPQS
jgi:hypothetical protein